jgi:nitrite reductase/ring-hydroxylating ferredoxin subunit
MDESATPAQEWHDFCSLEEIPDGGVLTRLQGGEDLLVYRNGPQVTCVPNYCPHRGWPFDGASVRNGVLTCPFHGYEFRLDTGQCLTSPGLPLDMYPVRIRDGRIEVKLKSA